MTKTTSSHQSIGQRIGKVDGLEKITGKARFGADINEPGMLLGKILRSPVAHAYIKKIDTSKAESIPGVRAVITCKDFPQLQPGAKAPSGIPAANLYHWSKTILARDKVLFHGHPVAAVAADTADIAQKAISAIKVEYEPLEIVLDPEESMLASAPILHEDVKTVVEVYGGEQSDQVSTSPSNIARHMQFVRGDTQEGFSQADVVVEQSYRTQTVHQGYIEPDSETADVRPDGTIIVWANTQGIFPFRNELAVLLDVPESRIRVIPTEVGGAFGGKIDARIAPLCVLLSKKSGRPVQLTLSRDEVLTSTGPGSAAVMKVKVGSTRTGIITAIEARLIYDAGAFPGAPLFPSIRRLYALYKTPNLKIDAFDVVTNKPRVADYRAPGGTSTGFAVESVIDELAEELGMDPIDFRLKNSSEEGDPMPTGAILTKMGLSETLQIIQQHSCWKNKLSGKNRGRGLAMGLWAASPATTTCHIRLNADASATLVMGTVDLSATRTSMSQILAEELGIEASEVRVLTGDTDSIPFSDASNGDKITFNMSRAIQTACANIKNQLLDLAALKLQVQRNQIVSDRNYYYDQSNSAKRLSLAELVAFSFHVGKPVFSYASSSAEGNPAPIAGGHVVDVEVDPETGKVSILQYTAFQDAGFAVNPSQFEGQVQGGALQGIGWALSEEYVFDEHGALQNSNLLDYRMMTSLDVPFIDIHIVEIASAENPFGIRGAGQVPIIPPAAALANAIYNATGKRIRSLPMNPERIYWELNPVS